MAAEEIHRLVNHLLRTNAYSLSHGKLSFVPLSGGLACANQGDGHHHPGSEGLWPGPVCWLIQSGVQQRRGAVDHVSGRETAEGQGKADKAASQPTIRVTVPGTSSTFLLSGAHRKQTLWNNKCTSVGTARSCVLNYTS